MGAQEVEWDEEAWPLGHVEHRRCGYIVLGVE